MKARYFLILALGVLLLGSVTAVQASIQPGQPMGEDPFKLTFDEFGHGYYQNINTDGSIDPILVPSPGVLVGGILTFALPEVVQSGDVAVLEPDGSLSDGLRFVPLVNNPSLANSMQYFSDISDIDDPVTLADHAFPVDWAPVRTVTEVGNEVFSDFTYPPAGEVGTGPNIYHGISDGAIPEPATILIWSFLSLCTGLGLHFGRRIRRPGVYPSIRTPWSNEARTAIHQIIERGRMS